MESGRQQFGGTVPSKDHSWNQGPEGKILLYLKNSKSESQGGPGVPRDGNGIV